MSQGYNTEKQAEMEEEREKRGNNDQGQWSAPSGTSWAAEHPQPRFFPSREAHILWRIDASGQGPGPLCPKGDTLKGNSSSGAFCNGCWAHSPAWLSLYSILLPSSPFYKGNTPWPTFYTLHSISEVGFLENLTWTQVSGDYYRAFWHKNVDKVPKGVDSKKSSHHFQEVSLDMTDSQKWSHCLHWSTDVLALLGGNAKLFKIVNFKMKVLFTFTYKVRSLFLQLEA